MEQRQGANTGLAVVLVLLGLGFFLVQLSPSPEGGSWMEQSWPLVLVAIGATLLVLGRIRQAPGMAVPAAILTGLGALFYWQNYTWNWESWAYVWTLIPGFVGIGFALSVLLGGARPLLARGESLIVLSLGLFALFTTFFSTIGFVGASWPLLSIVFGVLLLVRSLVLLGAAPHVPQEKAHQGEHPRSHLRQVLLGGR